MNGYSVEFEISDPAPTINTATDMSGYPYDGDGFFGSHFDTMGRHGAPVRRVECEDHVRVLDPQPAASAPVSLLGQRDRHGRRAR